MECVDGLLWGTSGGEGLPERVVSLILQDSYIGETSSQWLRNGPPE